MRKITKFMLALSLLFSTYAGSGQGVYAQEDTELEIQVQEEVEVSEETTNTDVETAQASTRAVTITNLDIYNPQDKYSFLTGDATIIYATLSATGLGDPVEGSTLEVLIPKQHIDIKDLSVGTVELVMGHQVVTEENHYRVIYELGKIGSGMRVDVPLTFSTKQYVTPDKEEIKIEVFLKDTQGNNIIAPASKTFTTEARYDDKVVQHYRFAQTGAWNVFPFSGIMSFPAGRINSEDPLYTSENLAELKTLYFTPELNSGRVSHRIGDRGYDKIEVIYNLPSEAVFSVEENPGWTYDEQTHSIFYTFDRATASTMSTLNGLYEGDATFGVKFPNVKSGTEVRFNGKLVAYPIGMSENETPREVVMKEEKLRVITTAQSPTDMNPTMYVNPYDIYDVTSARSEEIRISHDITAVATEVEYGKTNLENVQIESHKLNELLEYTEVRFIDSTVYQLEGNASVDVSVTYSDGTVEVIATDVKANEGANIQLPSDVTKITVVFTEGTYLPQGGKFRVVTVAKISDPESQILPDGSSGKSITVATGSFSGNYNGYDYFNQSLSKGTRITPYEPRVAISRSIDGPKPVYLASDILRQKLKIVTSRMENGQVVELGEMIEVLPLGVNYVAGSSYMSSQHDIPVEWRTKEPEVVYNYKNTGQTALIWQLPTVANNVTNTYDTSAVINNGELLTISYSAQKTKYVAEGDVFYTSYLSVINEEEIGLAKRSFVAPTGKRTGYFEDVYDVNENGSIEDQILLSDEITSFTPPGELLSKQEVQGTLDSRFLLIPAEGHAEFGGQIEYKLTLDNNSMQDLPEVYVLDLLPREGDRTVSFDETGPKSRGTTLQAPLAKAVETPAGWDVYYSVHEYGSDMKEFYENSSYWTTTVTDFSKVTAFKIEMAAGETLFIGETAEFLITLDVPGVEEVDTTQLYKVVNSQGLAISKNFDFIESNLSTAIVGGYAVEGIVYKDLNSDGVFTNFNEGIFRGVKVSLVDTDGNAVLDTQGNPIETLTDDQGRYGLNIVTAGEYRVKVEGLSEIWSLYSQTNTRNATENTSQTFTVNIENRLETVNLGFTKSVHIIEASATEGGTISPAGEVEAEPGSDVVFTFTPDTGYEVSQVLVNGVEVTVADTYTFSAIDQDHTIEVSFAKKQYTITATTGNGGSISSLGEIVVEYGDEKVYTITPDTGYDISQILVDGVEVAIADTYTFSAIDQDHTIEVSFAKKQYTIIATAGNGGSISSLGETVVEHGDEKVYTITPDTGYDISQILVDGVEVTIADSYTFSAIDQNHTIEVSFVKQKYTITVVTPEEGGTLSEDGEVTVEYGDEVTINITPEDGYEVGQILVDGEEVEISDSYTFSDIDEDHTFEVIFVLKKYLLTVRSNTLGKILPADPAKMTRRAPSLEELEHGEITIDIRQTVLHGETFEVIINPEDGYRVMSVYINGLSAEDSLVSELNNTVTYDIKNIGNDLDVVVIFGADDTTVIHTVNFRDCLGEIVAQAWPQDGMSVESPKGYTYELSELTNITNSRDVNPINCSGGFVIPNTGR